MAHEMFEQTIRNPHYGPQGQPYCVVAENDGLVFQSYFWTEAEANTCREQLLDEFVDRVHIIGLPTRIAGGA